MSLVDRPTLACKPQIQEAPAASRFAAYPASWYLLCNSRALARRPLSRQMLGRSIAAFRTVSGNPVVMDGRCSHLGADLGRGCVVGDSIECPFHGWRYGPDGRCTGIPAMDVIPSFARQSTYPTVERHGLLFFFNGGEPLFPLPFFEGARPDDYMPGRPFRFEANCSWYMLAAHGFDTQHFATVHARRLVGPPLIDCPHPCARRNRYTAEVVGDSIFDRLLRPLAGGKVAISISTWGGTLILITGTFQRVCSQFLIATQPLAGEKTLCQVITFTRRSRNPIARATLGRLSLAIRRLFTRGYMVDEIGRLGNPRYNPHSLLPCDADMIDYFCWAGKLA